VKLPFALENVSYDPHSVCIYPSSLFAHHLLLFH